MRRGELLRLTWTDIDFVSGTILVRLSKSGEARRIPLSPTAHRTPPALRDTRRERMRARLVKRSEAAGTVFTAPEGGFMMNLGRAWYSTPRGNRGPPFPRSSAHVRVAACDEWRGPIPGPSLDGAQDAGDDASLCAFEPGSLACRGGHVRCPGPKPWAIETNRSQREP